MTAPFRRIFRSHPRFSRTAWHLGVAAVLAVTAGLFLGPPARAQDAELESLLQRIERLQRDMNTLQRYVFKGGPVPAADALAGTAGEAGGLNRTAAAASNAAAPIKATHRARRARPSSRRRSSISSLAHCSAPAHPISFARRSASS